MRELRLPREPTNLIGWAWATHAPAGVRNVWDLAELVRLYPRLRPDDRLDQWLNLRLRSVILAPLLDREQVTGILLVANRIDEAGVFPSRDVAYATEVAKAIAGNLGAQLGRHAPTAATAPTTPAPAKRPSAPLARVATLPSLAETRPTTPMATVTSDRATESAARKPAGKWDHLIETGVMQPEVLAKTLASAASSGTDPGRYLIEKVGIARAEVEKAVSSYYGVPFYKFSAKQQIPEDLRLRLRVEFLRKICAVPISEAVRT